MLSGIKTRLSNVRTIKTLCESAENYALKDQQRQPAPNISCWRPSIFPTIPPVSHSAKLGRMPLAPATWSALNIGKPCAPLG